MSAATLIGIVIVALAVVGASVWYAVTSRQTQALHGRYGREYDRTVARADSRRAAEAELVARDERVEQFNLRPLSIEQRELFTQQWHDLQEAFVDHPGRVVAKADALVVEVMRDRGYPVTTFEQRADDLSVHHAAFVENYRAARDVAQRHRRGSATTEELRLAMVYYREIFEDLLQADVVVTDRPVSRAVERDVPLSVDPTTADGRAQRPPIAPPRPDREAR